MTESKSMVQQLEVVDMIQLRYQDFAYIVKYKRDDKILSSEIFHHPTDINFCRDLAKEEAENISLDIQNQDVRVYRTRNRKRDGEVRSAGR